MRRGLFADIPIPPAKPGDPTWALATLFPAQGAWTEEDFFQLETGHLVELANGFLEILPMPTWLHQRIVAWLFLRFSEWNAVHRIGEVLFAPLPLKLFPGTIREPDVLVVGKDAQRRTPEKYPTSALVTVEVVSDGAQARQRDLIAKRMEYARAGVQEYWIVDPLEKSVLVLRLDGSTFREHGRFGPGEQATSDVLTGLVVDCDAIWALENDVP